MDEPMKQDSLRKSCETKSKQPQDAAEAMRRKYNHYNLQLFVEMGEKRLQMESHEKRVVALRKELDVLKSTDWQYDPIEKYIGQT